MWTIAPSLLSTVEAMELLGSSRRFLDRFGPLNGDSFSEYQFH